MNNIDELKSTVVSYDETKNTMTIEWVGIIELDEFKNGMKSVLEQTKMLPYFNVIVNYNKMGDISAEARVWYQDFLLRDEGNEFLLRVKKFAVIKPSGMMPRLIVNSFMDYYMGIFPNLNYHQFVYKHVADEWIMSDSHVFKTYFSSLTSFIPNRLKLKSA